MASGSDRSANFVIAAKDAASSVLRGVGKEMGQLGKTGGAVFKSLAAAAAVVAAAIATAGAAALKFTRSAIDAAIADDAEQQKLIATLVARGVSTKQATDRINELIAAGQKLAFTDSEVRSGINIASQFTKDYAKQTKILTTAQNLARARNISLEQATKLVSKAFNGSGKSLKQYGVDLERTIYWTETKEKKDRKGLVTEEKIQKSRKEIIKGMKAVNLLNKEFAGVAEQYSQTFAGQFAIVKDSINETVESIGYAIGGGEGLPTFVRLLEGIRPVVDDLLGEINKNLPNIQRFSRELVEKFLAKLPGYVATAKRELPILIDKAKEFIGSVATFGKDIASYLGPDGLITAGIAGLGFKMAGLAGALGATFASEFIKMGVDPITATLTGTLAGAIIAGIVQGFASTLAQAAVTTFVGFFKSSMAAANIGGAVATSVTSGVSTAVAAPAIAAAGVTLASTLALAIPAAIFGAIALGVGNLMIEFQKLVNPTGNTGPDYIPSFNGGNIMDRGGNTYRYGGTSTGGAVTVRNNITFGNDAVSHIDTKLGQTYSYGGSRTNP